MKIIYRLRFKALRVPHCRPFKHVVYLTSAQSALSFAEQADWIPACAGMTNFRFLFWVFCFGFSVLVFCPCGNDGSRENAVRKVFGRHFLRFSGGGGFVALS
ncbi:hypothetical protein COH33_03195 [Neisseria meningitidis]|nr:hypothetical protein COH33_03195 [Neisseria meningitidis]